MLDASIVFVGVGKIILRIPGARSLKDKRMTVRSFKERVQARIHVSIAEVGELEQLQLATFGVAVVSNDAAICDEVLASVARAADTLKDGVLVDYATEIIPFGAGGGSLRGGLLDREARGDEGDDHG